MTMIVPTLVRNAAFRIIARIVQARFKCVVNIPDPFQSPSGTTDNSPAIHRGVCVPITLQVPTGRPSPSNLVDLPATAPRWRLNFK